MSKRKNGIGVSFLFAQDIFEKLVKVSEYLGQSRTVAVERAIKDYYEKYMSDEEKKDD